MKLIPGKAEQAINEVLHVEGVRIATEQITNLLPVSKRHKNHSKNSNWAKSRTGNLEFTVLTKGGAASNKGSYGYLVFPDEGRGRSNPTAHHFMQRGLDAATPIIVEKMSEKLTQIIQEVL
ncbi:hypothetical protein I2484_03980 [Sporosarcina sp. E16_8]|nr:hypothetical protein [Sporosarcina sp. E16_8]